MGVTGNNLTGNGNEDEVLLWELGNAKGNICMGMEGLGGSQNHSGAPLVLSLPEQLSKSAASPAGPRRVASSGNSSFPHHRWSWPFPAAAAAVLHPPAGRDSPPLCEVPRRQPP